MTMTKHFIPDLILTRKEQLALNSFAKAIESSIRWKKRFPHEKTYLRFSLQLIDGCAKRLQSEGLFLERYEKEIYSAKREAVSLVSKAVMCVQFSIANFTDVSEIISLLDAAEADGWDSKKNRLLLFCSVLDYACALSGRSADCTDAIFEHIAGILAKQAVTQ